jgi:hypothetical protein
MKIKGSTAIHNNSAVFNGGGIQECPATGTLSMGAGASITANMPNQGSSADPGPFC